MRFRASAIAERSGITVNKSILFALILITTISAWLIAENADAKRKVNPEQAERVIVVKDYVWASGGPGRPGIMKEITLENKGKMDYQNIEIEVDFYTTNDIPLGSLRSTIGEVLPAGSQQTFYNLNFGIMHSELKNSIARVVGAEVIETGTPTKAKDLILVQNWEWSGGQYGTEGIIKEITLENNSTENWKDIKIRVDFLGISGGKVGTSGFTSRAIIHDILPAKSTRTYSGINIGFRHPDAREVSISVMSAKPISDKEVRYRQAKKEGKSPKDVRVRKGSPSAEDLEDLDPEYYSADGKKLSLSERYKRKIEEEQGLPEGSLSDGDSTGEIAKYDPEYEETRSIRDVITKPSARGYTTADAGSEGYDDYGDDYYEEEVPLPKDDIIVEDFVWGGGVTQTIGFFREITLQNISGIDYTKIDLKVDFFSFTEETPMFSNRVTIVEVLPANSKKTFKNVKAGYLNAIPEEVRVEVLDAIPFSQY